MLNQFRQRYPLGSIISELLQIDHGKYVVRVSIQIEGTTLATGLSADGAIEQAEDTARMRALALLNLEPTTTAPEAIETNHRKSAVSTVTPAKIVQEPDATRRTSLDPEATSEPPPVRELKGGKTKKAPALEPPLPEPEPVYPTAEIDSSILEKEDVDPLPSSYEPPIEPSQTIPALEYPEEIDYSEIIAKIDVEMKRLGWTKEQGRDYLIQTYGKKSRQLLLDDELVGFLHYLESQ